ACSPHHRHQAGVGVDQMLGTEPRGLERYAQNPQRAIRAPDHWPLHRRWIANPTADATSIRLEILQPLRQSDSLRPDHLAYPAAIGRSADWDQGPPTTQNWQHCKDVCKRPLGPPYASNPPTLHRLRQLRFARARRIEHFLEAPAGELAAGRKPGVGA